MFSVGQLKAALNQVAASGSGKKRRQRRRKRTPGPRAKTPAVAGELTLSRTEYLCDLTKDAPKYYILEPESLPWLKKLTPMFERVRWSRVSLGYRPTCGTQTAGWVAIGFDWGQQVKQLKDVTKTHIMNCTPNRDGPAYQAFTINLPPSRLQSRLWYSCYSDGDTKPDVEDRGPGTIAALASVDAGELWVTYTVTLSGTR